MSLRQFASSNNLDTRNRQSATVIRNACLQIQRQWSTDERLRRAGFEFDQGIRYQSPEERLLKAVLQTEPSSS